MSHHHHKDTGSQHDHDNSELAETLELAHSKRGRKRLLVAGVANAAMGGAAYWVAHRSGANPTLIESIHDAGDSAYYITPWLITLRRRIEDVRVVKWVRGTAYAAGALAGIGAGCTIAEAVQNGLHAPDKYAIAAQTAFMIGNASVALYIGKEENGSVDRAARRHAITDARTSGVAAVCTATAVAVPILNPVGAALVAGMTIQNERTTINDANETLDSLVN